MKVWRLCLCTLLLSTALAFAGCAWVSREPEMSPQEVVTRFYRWYIGYPGNPLVDKAYRESPYLAESFIQEVDEALAGGVRADPILLAQDIPERFAVEEGEISKDKAAVEVLLYWGGNPTPSEREVHLQVIDGAWKITDVSMKP